MPSTTTGKKVTGFFPIHVTWKSLVHTFMSFAGPVLAVVGANNLSGKAALGAIVAGATSGGTGIIGLLGSRIADALDYRTNGGIQPQELTDAKAATAGALAQVDDIKNQWATDRNNIINQWHTDVNNVRAEADAAIAKAKTDIFALLQPTPAPGVPSVVTPPTVQPQTTTVADLAQSVTPAPATPAPTTSAPVN